MNELLYARDLCIKDCEKQHITFSRKVYDEYKRRMINEMVLDMSLEQYTELVVQLSDTIDVQTTEILELSRGVE